MTPKKIFYPVTICAIVWIFNAGPCLAQSSSKIYAVFLFNFAKSIELPAYDKEEFIIGVVGNDDIAKELTAAAGTRTIRNQKIKVKTFSTTAERMDCNLLFVDTNSFNTTNLQQKVNKETLIITDKRGSAKTLGGIALFLEAGKMRFQINLASIEKQNLKVPNSLTSLGEIVN